MHNLQKTYNGSWETGGWTDRQHWFPFDPNPAIPELDLTFVFNGSLVTYSSAFVPVQRNLDPDVTNIVSYLIVSTKIQNWSRHQQLQTTEDKGKIKYKGGIKNIFWNNRVAIFSELNNIHIVRIV